MIRLTLPLIPSADLRRQWCVAFGHNLTAWVAIRRDVCLRCGLTFPMDKTA